MKTIEDKMKKFLSKVKHILKTDLNSAHMIAGKIIFRKYFKNSKINIHEEYIEKIIGERGNAEEETKEYYQRKIDEIKTPQLKRKIHSLVKEMKLSNISLAEEDKNEKIFNNYKSQRNSKFIYFESLLNLNLKVRKIMSAKVINIKNELTDIFNLNKSMAIIKENNDISIDEIVNQEILPSEEIFFKKQKLKNKKLVSDMKKLFDL